MDEPVADDLGLAAGAAQVLDVAEDSVDLHVLELVDRVQIPVSIHLIEFSHVILYHINLHTITGEYYECVSAFAYVFGDLDGQALGDEDVLAKFADDVPVVGQAHGLVVLLLLAQLETLVGLWDFQHFIYFNYI